MKRLHKNYLNYLKPEIHSKLTSIALFLWSTGIGISCFASNSKVHCEMATPPSVTCERRGFSEYLHGHTKVAIQTYTTAIKLAYAEASDRLAGLYSMRGRLYEEVGDPRHDIADQTNAINLATDSKRKLAITEDLNFEFRHLSPSKTRIQLLSDYYFNRGVAYKDLSYQGRELNNPDAVNLRRAIADFGKALENPEGREGVLFERAYCYRALGDYHSAIKDYTQGHEQFPDNMMFLVHREEAYRKSGLVDLAMKDKQAIEEQEGAVKRLIDHPTDAAIDQK